MIGRISEYFRNGIVKPEKKKTYIHIIEVTENINTVQWNEFEYPAWIAYLTAVENG